MKKQGWRHSARRGIVVCGLVVIWGCASTAPEPVRRSPAATMQPSAQASAQNMATATAPSDGSLWDDRGALGAMFINAKARHIGDIVTIRIVESSKATNKANTSTDRSSSLNAGIDSFFGAEKRFPADQPFFNPFGRISGSMGSEFEGSGTTQRSGDLNAYMTAQIVDMLPNGNLIIEGNREVRVNNENQLITLTGMIRPRDIAANNVVQSTYIADARISYSGRGVVNDRQKPGWMTRVLDVVWPF
jgi:flagellar L-ring protein FlgH